MRKTWIPVLLACATAAGGCGASNAQFLTEDRKSNGLVIILPGIEGESRFNHDIRRGLVSAGLYRAMPIYSWGRPIPIAGPLINQMDIIGNRLAGIRIARMIEQYQDAYPDRPVYLVGHSGGGGVAVFAAEALKDDRQVDGLVLLSASISSGYDLTKALAHCRNGIVNFYTKADVAFLMIGTTLAGNVDGMRGPAAGAVGFSKSFPKLYQVELADSQVEGDAHSAATHAAFVSTHVAPWLTANWPAGAYASPARGEAKILASAAAVPIR
ncbi:MAG TPA: hypothetical protein DCX07_16465 [Phycisphaerales bacterium]|nr:hypothetical protein [Phycisphaerales bacterium]